MLKFYKAFRLRSNIAESKTIAKNSLHTKIFFERNNAVITLILLLKIPYI